MNQKFLPTFHWPIKMNRLSFTVCAFIICGITILLISWVNINNELDVFFIGLYADILNLIKLNIHENTNFRQSVKIDTHNFYQFGYINQQDNTGEWNEPFTNS